MYEKQMEQTKPLLCALQSRGHGNTDGWALDGKVTIFPLNEILFCRIL